jgi:hypothetical protein
VASLEHRAQVASRASILREWKETDSYALVHMLNTSERDKAMNKLRLERNPDEKTYLQGYLDALDFASGHVERSIREHNRQVEAA